MADMETATSLQGLARATGLWENRATLEGERTCARPTGQVSAKWAQY